MIRHIRKLPKPLLLPAIIQHLRPLTEIRRDQHAHLLLEARGDPQLVLEDHVPEVLDAAGERLEPARRALQFVRRADVEH